MKTLRTLDQRGVVLREEIYTDGNLLTSTDYSYDELMRPVGKTTGSVRETFAYDIRGWQTGHTAKRGSSSIYSEALRYMTPTTGCSVARWTGLISESVTQHYGASARRDSYGYDAIGRLTSSNLENNIRYDANGNVTALRRLSATGTTIADLTMSYSDGGNRLQSVTNTGSEDTGTFSYEYDSSGNLTSDGRKRLEIQNNVLNLPSVVSAWDASGAMAGLMTYTYLGDGTKVAARVPKDLVGYVKGNFSDTSRSLLQILLDGLPSGGSAEGENNGAYPGKRYRGSFMYDISESGVQSLESVAVSTGRLIALTGTNGAVSFESDGFITDHLGNVAAVVNLSAPQSASTGAFIIEQNEYTPFGTKLSVSGLKSQAANRWRYAGKEEQDIAGMDLRLLDFGARFYDPYTLRWNAVDPLASSYLNSSPYVYCNNSPVNIVDPIGMNWYSYSDENGETQYKYVEGQMSRKEMKEGGYKDCGQTMEVNGQYYSLFGAIVPMVDNNGFEVGKAYKVIDKMIRKYYGPKEISNQDDNSMIKYDVHGRNFMFNYCGKEFSSSKDGTICYPSNEKTWRGIQMTGADNLIVKEAFSSEHPLLKEMSGKLFSNHNWPSGYWLIGIDASPTATDQVLIQVRFDKNNKDALMKAIKKQFGK